MCTSVFLIALGLLPAVPLDTPAWMTDYSSARTLGREEGKPLAVFIGSGKAGWKEVSKDGALRRETERLLAQRYVCVYVDTDKEKGRELASAFEVRDGLGLVISDAAGKLQAFHHDGDLAEPELRRQLERFSDPDRVVDSTETMAPRLSYYAPPPVVTAPTPQFYPMFMGGGMGGFGGRACST